MNSVNELPSKSLVESAPRSSLVTSNGKESSPNDFISSAVRYLYDDWSPSIWSSAEKNLKQINLLNLIN